MEKGYFITGTDTNAGKTWAAVTLLHYFKVMGKSVIAMKPVASGCRMLDGRLVNEDALLLQKHASAKAGYDLINPYAFAAPVSPHIAGKNDPVSLSKVIACFNELTELAEIILVEGAGGWYSPVNDREDIADLAKALALPVIIVVAIKLGCINHAKLTYGAVRLAGMSCAGWIATCPDGNMQALEETIQTIKNSVTAPFLGVLPYRQRAGFNFFARQLKL